MDLPTIGLVVFGYLIGSVPFSWVVARTKGIDLRKVGSGNTGASNVWRSAGFKFFVVALFLDIFKGWLPTFLAHYIFETSPLVTITVGLCAVLGHVFPIFMGFRGGKAVATTGGVIMGFAPILTLTAAIVWTIVYQIWKYPSVASLVDGLVIAILATIMAYFDRLDNLFAVFVWAAVLFMFYLHRANIQRLMRGQEIGIGSKR
jgi:acyl phosphate:glycerol-3-phosphate acyltransferase